jgi:hypothetical protein
MTTPTAACATPIPWEELVAYWAGELDEREVDRLDDHLIGCPTCSAESARVSAVTEALRAMIPPIIDHARLESLRAAGRGIRDNPVVPDERRLVVFDAQTDLLIHRLRCDLSRAARVEVHVTAEGTGTALLLEPSAPFDRDSGEVLIACQRHFENFPHDILVEVHAHDAAGVVTIARFPLPHVFEPRAGE